MKVAFISYEYPPDTAHGGIATYVHQAAHMLAGLGHYVEVFAGSGTRTASTEEDGILVHRIGGTDLEGFSDPAGQRLADRHREVHFDVLEGPEFMADARGAVARIPDMPLVVKLHTPSRLLLRLNYYETSFVRRLRLFAWGLRHGHPATWGYAPEIEGHRANVERLDAVERGHARDADEVATPSRALGEILAREWSLDPSRIACVPYPCVPESSLLEAPVRERPKVVTYVGRLETRKGVLDLAAAIPTVLRRHPDVKFRFVGAADASPEPGRDMRQYLAARLRTFGDSVEFTGPVPPREIPTVLAATDLCVFPSVWENFPYVCLEAMAAGRAIVGSDAGGMAEMLDGGQAGCLVPPREPRRLAAALVELLADPARCRRLGEAARERILAVYGPARIGPLQVASYERAIKRRSMLGSRRVLSP